MNELVDFALHLRRIINKRYVVTDCVLLMLLYLSVGCSYHFLDFAVANIILALVLVFFFVFFAKAVSRDLDPIRYIVSYMPETNKLIRELDSKLNAFKPKGRKMPKGAIKKELDSIIDDCVSSLRYTQVVEVTHLIIIFLLMFLFFPLATYTHLRANRSPETVIPSVRAQIYNNMETISTIGYNEEWAKMWKDSEGGSFREFVCIQTISMIVFTVGYVSLLITNVISLKPQVFRDELRNRFL